MLNETGPDELLLSAMEISNDELDLVLAGSSVPSGAQPEMPPPPVAEAGFWDRLAFYVLEKVGESFIKEGMDPGYPAQGDPSTGAEGASGNGGTGGAPGH